MAATGLLSTVPSAVTVPAITSLAGAPTTATATGVAPIGATDNTITGGTPALPNVTPANVASTPAPAPVAARTITDPETVSGQLNALLSKDSTYMQSARSNAMATANSRGLINSSIAAGAGEKAAIDSSLPIAQQDATTNANANQSAQQANQDLGLTGYKSLLDSAQQATNFGYSTAQNAQNIAGNMQIQNQAQTAASALQKQTADATSTLQTTLKNMDIGFNLQQLDEQTKNSLAVASAPIIQQVQSEISLIQRTPDEQLSPQAKADAINYQNQALQSQLVTLSSLYGYNITWPTATATAPYVAPPAATAPIPQPTYGGNGSTVEGGG